MEKGRGLLPLETFHYYDLTLGEKFEGGVVRTTTKTRSTRSTRIIYIYDEKGVCIPNPRSTNSNVLARKHII